MISECCKMPLIKRFYCNRCKTKQDVGKVLNMKNNNQLDCETCEWRMGEIGYPSPCPIHEDTNQSDWKKELMWILEECSPDVRGGIWDVTKILHKLEEVLKSQEQQIRETLYKEMKKMKATESDGWENVGCGVGGCCPGDDWADGYNQGIKDALGKIK